MPPPGPIVTLDKVDVEIDGSPVLREISLDIRDGEQWGLVGGNGSGKSTLLALIAGKRWPAPGRGRRRYDFGSGPERDAVSARERVALVGHELQDLYFARRWNFRALDVVVSGVSRHDVPQRARTRAQVREAESLLERMQLGHLRERRILELSRGEQRRVLIARALAFRPALLLLDEPASGLDARARDDLETMLHEVAGLTTTVTAVHESAELPAIVNRVTAIRSGRLTPLAETQTPEEAAAHSRGGSDSPAAAAAAAPRGRLMIELRQAGVWLDGRRILEPLDWQLREGEHWLVRGPNGAGKSTLLRLLHAEIRPERGGTVRWPGLGDPADVWALRRHVALVSPELQAKYLFPTRVFDAVASGFTASIGRTREPTPEEQARVRALLAAFEIEPLAARPLSSLSYGQRHRTLIARTLATEPRVLLLDEPWEGIDARSTGVICRELRRAMQTGTQIVCASHLGARGLPLNRSLSLGAGRVLSARDSAAPTGSSASERWRAADCPQR